MSQHRKSALPVYSPFTRELLYYAPVDRVQRAIDLGRVRPLGSTHRVRGLVAMREDAAQLLLALARPKAGTKFSHRNETDDNPPGVWTFRRLQYAG